MFTPESANVSTPFAPKVSALTVLMLLVVSPDWPAVPYTVLILLDTLFSILRVKFAVSATNRFVLIESKNNEQLFPTLALVPMASTLPEVFANPTTVTAVDVVPPVIVVLCIVELDKLK